MLVSEFGLYAIKANGVIEGNLRTTSTGDGFVTNLCELGLFPLVRLEGTKFEQWIKLGDTKYIYGKFGNVVGMYPTPQERVAFIAPERPVPDELFTIKPVRYPTTVGVITSISEFAGMLVIYIKSSLHWSVYEKVFDDARVVVRVDEIQVDPVLEYIRVYMRSRELLSIPGRVTQGERATLRDNINALEYSNWKSS